MIAVLKSSMHILSRVSSMHILSRVSSMHILSLVNRYGSTLTPAKASATYKHAL